MKPLLSPLGLAFFALQPNAGALEFRSVEQDGKSFTVCQVNVRNDHLQLFHKDDSGTPFKRLQNLSTFLSTKGRKLLFAMNAGMYHPNYEAVGLFIADEKLSSQLNTASGFGNFFLKPNGVFMLSKNKVRVLDSNDFATVKSPVTLASQSGPLLVKNSEIHPAFKPNSDSRHIRNGVGVSSPDTALFVIRDEPVNFHEFARLFKDTLHCSNALYFDGNVSSLYAPELRRNDSKCDIGPIIAVTD